MRTIKAKTVYNTWKDGIRALADILNNEPTFTVTLDVSASSTTVACQMVGINSVISFMPTTANAAADMNSMFVSSRGDASFVVSHDFNGNADRTFAYSVEG